MKRKIIIDGYNLMHQMADLQPHIRDDLEAARKALIIRITGYAQRHNIRTVLVFDGRGPQQAGRGGGPLVKVVYSKPPENADMLIKRLADQIKPGQYCEVVSSDREIQRYVKTAGCRPLSSPEFVRRLQRPAGLKTETAEEPAVSDREVREWMRLFREVKPEDR